MPLSTAADRHLLPWGFRRPRVATALLALVLAALSTEASAQFGPPVAVDLGVGVSPDVITAVAAGDIDGDGVEDLAGVDDAGNGNIGVALGTGGGSYAAPVLSGPTGALSGAFLLALGDFDLDGFLDAVYSGRSLDGGGVNVETVFVVRADPANPGSYLMATPILFQFGAADEVTEINLTDFDLDGNLDILLAIRPGRRIEKIPGGPGMTFGPIVSIGSAGGGATDIDVCVDINNDGFKDIVLASSPGGAAPGRIEVFRGQDPVINPGQPIDPNPIAVIAMPPGTSPTNVHWIDCNQDKRYDLIVALEGQVEGLAILQNLGPPNFFQALVPAPNIVLGTTPNSSIRLEVDFDGVEDLSVFTFNSVTPAAAPTAFEVYRVLDCQLTQLGVTSSGTFDSTKVEPTKARLHDVDDQNGDGAEDVALVTHMAPQDRVLVYPNLVQTDYTISPPKPQLAQKVQFTFRLQAPAGLAGRPFVILFGVNGTIPGVSVGGGVHLPLNPPFLPLQLSGTIPTGGQLVLTTPSVSIPPAPQAFSAQVASVVVIGGGAPGSIAYASNPAVVTVP